MRSEFPELASQEEIDIDRGFQWFKWYMIFSGTLSVIFYVAVIAAIVKYLLS